MTSNTDTPPETYTLREQDWRNGAVVYQVYVDRFAPSGQLDAKRDLYSAPKTLRGWSERPTRGRHLPEAGLYSHELDFWGGDLESVRGKLDYVQQLGADVLYLNPIHLAHTNHKYDALDFLKISPEYGTDEDLARLAEDAHERGMKLVLDGVFNHMGRNAPVFQEALRNAESSWREWFAIGPEYQGGARAWVGVQNLPELNLENPAVRGHIFADPDSAVRHYLRAGADGWRLDVAFELGYDLLRDLTAAAHDEKPGSLVVGEIVNYPADWLHAARIDAVMNFPLRYILLGMAVGEIAPARAGRLIDRMVRDAGIEPILKCWSLLDNHDRPRLATLVPDPSLRQLVQALQFTLPGSPQLYYGSELGMTGGEDPENRAPMRWALVRDDNPDLAWTRRLAALHKQHRALRVGDFRLLDSDKLLAFERFTDRALESVIVLANPTAAPVTEPVMIPHSSLQDDTPLVDILSLQPPSSVEDPAGSGAAGSAAGNPSEQYAGRVDASFVSVTLPPKTIQALMPRERPLGGYSRYKRMR